MAAITSNTTWADTLEKPWRVAWHGEHFACMQCPSKVENCPTKKRNLPEMAVAIALLVPSLLLRAVLEVTVYWPTKLVYVILEHLGSKVVAATSPRAKSESTANPLECYCGSGYEEPAKDGLKSISRRMC